MGKVKDKKAEDTELNTLLFFIENPSEASCAAAMELNICERSVMRILQRHNFKPYIVLHLEDNNLQDR